MTSIDDLFYGVICMDTGEDIYTYDEYLKSDHWKNIKRKYINIKGDKCRICNNIGQELHHLTYKSLGNERVDDLMLLCSLCHENVHDLENEYY